MGPKISVCIPTFNQARYLAAAIESVLGQSLTDFELLIIDDCSQDGTREVGLERVQAESRCGGPFPLR